MAAKKLLTVASDGSQATYSGKTTSAGAGDAGEVPVLDGAGKLDISMMPNGVGGDALTLTSGEALTAGDYVYISAAGLVFKADNSAIGKAARGYVLQSVAITTAVVVYFDDNNTGVTGKTPGVTYYTSSTAGAVTASPDVTTVGKVLQEVGFATSASSIHTNIQEPIVIG